MVLSSIAPLFVLWAIRGIDLFPHLYVAIVAIACAIVPTAYLAFRYRTAQKEDDKYPLTIEGTEDHRGHVLTYLFAILLPFYRDTIDSYFDFAAILAALAIVVFLFWHLNYHYVNLLFAIKGYHVIMVYPEASRGSYGRTTRCAVITRRDSLLPGEQITAYRLSNAVYVAEDS